MEKEINSVVKYFSLFAYQPTLDEIHRFLRVKISKNELKKELEHMIKQKIIAKCKIKNESYERYTLLEYGIRRKISTLNQNPKVQQVDFRASKIKISQKKLENWRFRIYIKLLLFFPQIKLVGLSGSISMMNADLDDDIDLFIITQKERLFTGRFLAITIAFIMGLKRKIGFKKAPNKVCLNLFFDESKLKVPKVKETEFVAHEILQMKPIVNKSNLYERLLKANGWVFKLFPNAKSKSQILNLKSQINLKRLRFKILNLFGTCPPILRTWNLGFRVSNKVESFLKSFQLLLIKKHQTTEIITNSQLWFHPDDFGKKIKY